VAVAAGVLRGVLGSLPERGLQARVAQPITMAATAQVALVNLLDKPGAEEWLLMDSQQRLQCKAQCMGLCLK
jgi:hypothetical protein